ncbi:hypothetical protein [Nocardioides panacisoli]|uniref:Lipoprotein n=1 Tax=Nocardioides panacisoli TaxID=627624 RepID=A0ABP7IPI3_9ACTN
MRSHAPVLLTLTAAALTVSLAACSSDDTGASSTSSSEAASEATSTPASSAAPTNPVPDPAAAVQACLDGGNLSTTPEDGPRFGAVAEFQVVPPDSGSDLGMFVYATPDDAAAHQKDLDDAGASSTEVIGTVVLAGTLDAPAGEADSVAVVQACAAATVG